jgi:hypothetical protein
MSGSRLESAEELLLELLLELLSGLLLELLPSGGVVSPG